MRKLLATMLGVTMAAALLTGCGSKAATETVSEAATEAISTADAVAEDAQAIVDEVTAAVDGGLAEGSTFTVGFDAEFPPYGYMDDNGEYTGFDLELAQEVCDRNGWELVKQPIDWDAKDAELNSGTIDCIWNGFTMNGREDAYTWSEPYVDNSQVFVVASDAGIATQADLAGKNVGVQKDSSALAALEGDSADLAATFGDLTQYSDYNTAFMDLETGAIDALAIDIGVANYQVKSRGEGFQILDENLSSEQYAVGFKLGNTVLCEQVQTALNDMVADGTFTKIADKYADFGIPDSVCLGK